MLRIRHAQPSASEASAALLVPVRLAYPPAPASHRRGWRQNPEPARFAPMHAPAPSGRRLRAVAAALGTGLSALAALQVEAAGFGLAPALAPGLRVPARGHCCSTALGQFALRSREDNNEQTF